MVGGRELVVGELGDFAARSCELVVGGRELVVGGRELVVGELGDFAARSCPTKCPIVGLVAQRVPSDTA